MASVANMHMPSYLHLKRGEANPSLGSMYRIARALGVEVRDLLQPSEIKDRSLTKKMEYLNTLSESDQAMIKKARLEKLQDVKMKNRLKELSAIWDRS